MALLNVPNITPQSTPVLQDRGDPALPSLLHRTYWLFLNAMQAVSGLMASAIDTLQVSVADLLGRDYVYRVSAQGTLNGAINAAVTSLVVTSATGFPDAPFAIQIDTEILYVSAKSGTTFTVARAYGGSAAAAHVDKSPVLTRSLLIPGAVTKVNQEGILTESALTDDGTVLSLLSRLFDSNKTIRSTGFQNPAAGSGVELKYDTGAGVGLVVVYDRTGAAWLPLALYGSTVSFLPQSGTTTNTGHLDLNGGGIYKIGGVSGITATITTAKLTALGANGSMTFTGGILTAQTQAT